MKHENMNYGGKYYTIMINEKHRLEAERQRIETDPASVLIARLNDFLDWPRMKREHGIGHAEFKSNKKFVEGEL